MTRCLLCPALWPDDGDALLRRLHWLRPVYLQNSDGNGRPAGFLEPDFGPLGLHLAAARRAQKDLPHHEAPGRPEGQRVATMGWHVIPQLGKACRQQDLKWWYL